MGGKNELDRIRDEGIALRKPAQPLMAVDEISFAPEGHPLWHPRAHLAVDSEIVDSIKSEGFRRERPLLIREEGKVKGKLRFYLVAGSRRLKACWQAQKELAKAGDPRLDEGRLFVPVILLKGDYAAALIARLEENGDPTKLKDTLGVLYQMFKALEDNGVDAKEIRRHAPRDCDVNAILRWPQVCKSVQARIESGEGSAAMIDPLADTPMAEQEALFNVLVASGATTARKAKREAKKARGETVVRRASPAALAAFSKYMNPVFQDRVLVPVDAIAAYFNGDSSLLAEFDAKLVAEFDAVWAEAAKSGRRARKAEAAGGESVAAAEAEGAEPEVEAGEALAAAGGEAE